MSGAAATAATTTPQGRVAGAIVQVADGPDAGRQTATGDSGCYVLEGLREATFGVRVTAAGFARGGGVVELTSDQVLDLAISRELPDPQPPSAFPDTDPGLDADVVC